MSKFIVGTFLILGWAFYVLSDGSNFVPEQRVVAEAQIETENAIVALVVEPEPEAVVEVTRAETSSLLDLSTGELTQAVATIDGTSQPVAVEIAAVLETVVEEAPVVEAITTDLDIRLVSGTRVNMRSGPGTNYAVLDTLTGGTAAEVIEVDASGWARIRISDTGAIGWMAERLLTES